MSYTGLKQGIWLAIRWSRELVFWLSTPVTAKLIRIARLMIEDELLSILYTYHTVHFGEREGTNFHAFRVPVNQVLTGIDFGWSAAFKLLLMRPITV